MARTQRKYSNRDSCQPCVHNFKTSETVRSHCILCGHDKAPFASLCQLMLIGNARCMAFLCLYGDSQELGPVAMGGPDHNPFHKLLAISAWSTPATSHER
eukprot:6183406-Pleurochrysis_carterae.AAC.3